jgi:hypothetical protein
VAEKVGPFPTKREATDAAERFAFERYGLVPRSPSKRCSCRRRR